MVKDSHVVHCDSFHIIGQAEALSTDEKAAYGMDICERVDGFAFEVGLGHVTFQLLNIKYLPNFSIWFVFDFFFFSLHWEPLHIILGTF